MGSTQEIWSKFEKWCRLVILVQEGGESVCKHILHTEMNVPTEGGEMYKYLESYKDDIKKSKMFSYQRKILLPDDGIIDTTKLDIPLFTYVIQILDKSKKYPSIENLRYKRNELFHMEEVQRNMTSKQFNGLWDEVAQLLNGLNFDMSLLNSLKSDNLFLNQHHKMILGYILEKGNAGKLFFFCEYQSCHQAILPDVFKKVIL